MKRAFVYFKIVKDRQEYLGNRYFKVDWSSDHIVQVCVHPGEPKRGRASNFGVYLISKQTFLSNYMPLNYVEPCTKGQFEKQFDTVVKLIK